MRRRKFQILLQPQYLMDKQSLRHYYNSIHLHKEQLYILSKNLHLLVTKYLLYMVYMRRRKFQILLQPQYLMDKQSLRHYYNSIHLHKEQLYILSKNLHLLVTKYLLYMVFVLYLLLH
jgi:hypothetical protein